MSDNQNQTPEEPFEINPALAVEEEATETDAEGREVRVIAKAQLRYTSDPRQQHVNDPRKADPR